MSLTRQTINVTTRGHKQLTLTMPAEHVYPFIIHRSVEEHLEKKRKERTRYSKKHCVTHLLTGAVIGVFPSYENALIFARKLKDRPIFLMPTIELMNSHPDWDEVAGRVGRLKLRYGIDE
tara:strand:+ start:140 stop:499 length:360 start_codon:yes stop_codon:yes gene_type:complete